VEPPLRSGPGRSTAARVRASSAAAPLAPAGAVAVAGEGERPGHAQPGAFGGARHLRRAGRVDAAAVVAAVDLDDDLGPGAAQGRTEHLDGLDRVGAHAQRHPSGQRAQPVAPAPGGPDRVGDEQVGAAGAGEHLGLAHRGHGQPDGAGVELAAGDLHALVGLGVRAQRQPPLPRHRGRAPQVAVEHVEVEGQVGGVVEVHPPILTP
jgi:hypothetical protein